MAKRVTKWVLEYRVSLWDSLMFGRLAMGFASVRAGTRVLMLVLVQASAAMLAYIHMRDISVLT